MMEIIIKPQLNALTAPSAGHSTYVSLTCFKTGLLPCGGASTDLKARIVDVLDTVDVEVVSQTQHEVQSLCPGKSVQLCSHRRLVQRVVRGAGYAPPVTQHRETKRICGMITEGHLPCLLFDNFTMHMNFYTYCT